MLVEKIKEQDDFWLCICGNEPDQDGFYACDDNGNEVEPTNRDWKTNNYVCMGCGRIIDCKSLEVVKKINPINIQILV